MKHFRTELVFILDRSGSMAHLEKDTIGGFNAMIERQKAQPGECMVSTVLFDTECTVLHDRIPLNKIQPMTDRDYSVRGCTALLDAIGGAIHHIGNIHKYARKEDIPDRTMFIITTDGFENASCRYTGEQIRHMIERQKQKYGWEFLFIGANMDAVKTAKEYGIEQDRAVTYHSDSIGTKVVYASVSDAISGVRQKAMLSEDWRKEIDADYQHRKNQRDTH